MHLQGYNLQLNNISLLLLNCSWSKKYVRSEHMWALTTNFHIVTWITPMPFFFLFVSRLSLLRLQFVNRKFYVYWWMPSYWQYLATYIKACVFLCTFMWTVELWFDDEFLLIPSVDLLSSHELKKWLWLISLSAVVLSPQLFLWRSWIWHLGWEQQKVQMLACYMCYVFVEARAWFCWLFPFLWNVC